MLLQLKLQLLAEHKNLSSLLWYYNHSKFQPKAKRHTGTFHGSFEWTWNCNPCKYGCQGHPISTYTISSNYRKARVEHCRPDGVHVPGHVDGAGAASGRPGEGKNGRRCIRRSGGGEQTGKRAAAWSGMRAGAGGRRRRVSALVA